MKIALDPFMHRHLSLEALPSKVAELGYEWIELSPRGDFLEWFKAPRVYPARIKAVKKAFKDANVGIASLLPMYRWASNDEVERQAAVKHWKRAIEIAVELGVDTMNSEFGRGPHPDKGSCYCCHTGSMIEACEDAWWRSMEELVPVFEQEGIKLHVEPHPEDWCETIQPALDIIRTVNSKQREVPLLRAAHLLFRRRHRRDAARERRRARPRPRRRHLQPQGLLGPALHPQPAGHAGARPPAPQHRPGRGAVGRLLRHPRRDQASTGS